MRQDGVQRGPGQGRCRWFYVGGVAGAVVGGITGGKQAHQKCANLCIEVTSSFQHGVSGGVYFTHQRRRRQRTAELTKRHIQDAQEILSLLQVICSAVEKMQQADRSTFSGADELRKWKQLLDEGVITREEFETKKRQLLDL